MSEMTLKDISKIMRDIDICMMTTTTASGALESRPMSNNREVDYTGDSYFFTYGSYDVAREIESSPQVSLGYSHRPALMGKDTYIAITGNASVIRDKSAFEQHWVPDLDEYFPQGIDTPDLAMLQVKATHVKYWQGMEKGEVSLTGSPSNKAA